MAGTGRRRRPTSPEPSPVPASPGSAAAGSNYCWAVATYDYPDDLLTAQQDLNQVRADLTAQYERLP